MLNNATSLTNSHTWNTYLISNETKVFEVLSFSVLSHPFIGALHFLFPVTFRCFIEVVTASWI
uniref:Uncharacterized protein n=1 Tax=Mus musculus TaxID=10090 RepID=Q3U1K8_MOUSE|nr:unnamed protein product [Mus musculus]